MTTKKEMFYKNEFEQLETEILNDVFNILSKNSPSEALLRQQWEDFKSVIEEKRIEQIKTKVENLKRNISNVDEIYPFEDDIFEIIDEQFKEFLEKEQK